MWIILAIFFLSAALFIGLAIHVLDALFRHPILRPPGWLPRLVLGSLLILTFLLLALR
jgi:hypothetical protein